MNLFPVRQYRSEEKQKDGFHRLLTKSGKYDLQSESYALYSLIIF